MQGCIAGLLEGDEAAGEHQEGEVVLFLFRPADEDPAVAVEPRVTGFDDPAAGAPSGDAQLVLDLLSPRADVGDEPVATDELPGALVVIGLVEAEALRLLGGGLRPRYGDGVEGTLKELVVVAVGTFVGEADGDPGALGED